MEGDLYRIAALVREYDGDARLVREDGSGVLGLCRWVEPSRVLRGGFTAPRPIHDLDTDRPLCGEPDARVLRFQRSTDSWGRDLRKWHERSEAAAAARKESERRGEYDRHLDNAERFMNVMKRDVSARPRAFIGDGLPGAA